MIRKLLLVICFAFALASPGIANASEIPAQTISSEDSATNSQFGPFAVTKYCSDPWPYNSWSGTQ